MRKDVLLEEEYDDRDEGKGIHWTKRQEQIREEKERMGCAGKDKYRSQKHAHDVAVHIMKYKRNVRLREYHCPGCHWWHITSASKVKWSDSYYDSSN